MEKKIKKQNFYFTQETEDAIVEYNNTTDDVARNRLYATKIHPALYKLAEIMIHRFKFYNFDISHEDVKHEVVVFLHDKLPKYDQSTGFKAYSYFSIVAKNYLIAENNKNYYQAQKRHSVDSIDIERNVVNEVLRAGFVEEQCDYIDMYIELMEKYLAMIFPKSRDLQIADSVLYLFRNRENIENYNKKALYILIKERTGAKSQYITSAIKLMKDLYDKLYREYDDGVDITKFGWYDMRDIIDD
jgi:hypothetical protein